MHKAILSKVPYFNATVGGGFKVQTHPYIILSEIIRQCINAHDVIILQETLQEKITIQEFFEPFEIQWLLAYIYFPRKLIDLVVLSYICLATLHCIEASSFKRWD